MQVRKENCSPLQCKSHKGSLQKALLWHWVPCFSEEHASLWGYRAQLWKVHEIFQGKSSRLGAWCLWVLHKWSFKWISQKPDRILGRVEPLPGSGKNHILVSNIINFLKIQSFCFGTIPFWRIANTTQLSSSYGDLFASCREKRGGGIKERRVGMERWKIGGRGNERRGEEVDKRKWSGKKCKCKAKEEGREEKRE